MYQVLSSLNTVFRLHPEHILSTSDEHKELPRTPHQQYSHRMSARQETYLAQLCCCGRPLSQIDLLQALQGPGIAWQLCQVSEVHLRHEEGRLLQKHNTPLMQQSKQPSDSCG